MIGQSNCGNVNYQKDHAFGEFTEHEERGVLVITHGKRAGRIYTTEHSWRERACKECGVIQRDEEVPTNIPWPNFT